MKCCVLKTNGHSGFHSNLLTVLTSATLLGLAVQAVNAATFGIYEARGLAMGGAMVASSGTAEAHYYNPALVAIHDGREEDGQDNRFLFSILLQGAGPVESLQDFYEQELDVVVSDSIDAFNAAPGAATAAEVLLAVENIDAAADELGAEPVVIDGSLGFSISLPGDREGGTFFFSNRLLMNESALVTDADQALMEEYKDAMRFIATGGAEGSPGSDIFEDGELLDPKEFLTSTAVVSGVAISEFGIALAREFDLLGTPVAFGITPKVQRLIVYSQALNFADDDIELLYTENSDSFIRGNLDLGVSAQIADIYRMGFSIKDVFKHDYSLDTGRKFSFDPGMRLGGALINGQYTAALDIDVVVNKSIFGEPETQQVALGGAYRPATWIELRGGYQTDLKSNMPDALSLGVGIEKARMVAELSVSQGSDFFGAALKLGWAF